MKKYFEVWDDGECLAEVSCDDRLKALNGALAIMSAYERDGGCSPLLYEKIGRDWKVVRSEDVCAAPPAEKAAPLTWFQLLSRPKTRTGGDAA